ncbi:MAG TPA: hypothetical protein VLV78_00345 [Thermoanaerobaculia bacterium]|nr:hypothetical protein [Thermoanaerobaculia bacterium]
MVTAIDFTYSLALLLVGQIPLLVKFYFDHKSKKDAFRQDIFTRQVNAYTRLAQLTTRLHRNQHHAVQFYGHTPKDTSEKELITSPMKDGLKNWTSWTEVLDECELVIHSRLVVLLAEYRTRAIQILSADSFGVTIKSRDELIAAWKEQNDRYNAIINSMRLFIGTDALTSEITKLIHESREHLFLHSGYEID